MRNWFLNALAAANFCNNRLIKGGFGETRGTFLCYFYQCWLVSSRLQTGLGRDVHTRSNTPLRGAARISRLHPAPLTRRMWVFLLSPRACRARRSLGSACVFITFHENKQPPSQPADAVSLRSGHRHQSPASASATAAAPGFLLSGKRGRVHGRQGHCCLLSICVCPPHTLESKEGSSV